ncbi:hypothetical protein OBBRIDRAFT_762951, partial [Obba rivulosa]
MSTGFDSSLYIALVEGEQIQAYLVLVSCVLLCYDYLLTFSLELDLFWKEFSLTWVSALFIINRYGPRLSIAPLILVTFADLPEHVCRPLHFILQYYTIFTQFTVGCLLGIRTFALYGRSKRILALLLATGIVTITISIWIVFSDRTFVNNLEGPILPGHSCNTLNFAEQSHQFAGTWAAAL